MKPFTFVHAADLHLGAPFKGVSARLPQSMAATLRNATFDAFDALITLCLEEEAAFLLVAGDVFDDARRSLRAQLAFRDGTARLSEHGIRTFGVFGNHDPKDAWSSMIHWPENLHLFGSDSVETEVVDVAGIPTAAVSGIGYRQSGEARNLVHGFRAERPDLFQIALLHTSCGHHPLHADYAPCTLGALVATGHDYWALGHVHERACLSTDPLVVYPGNIQGLSVRETGPRGCYRVSVGESGRATADFHPLDAIRWLTATVDLTPMETLEALDQALSMRVDALAAAADARPAIGRVTLTGRSAFSAVLGKQETRETFLERARAAGLEKDPPVWIQDLHVDCQPQTDLSRRRQMDDLVGQTLREAAALGQAVSRETGGGNCLPAALAPALGGLFHHRRLARWLDPLTPDDCERLLRGAERLCLDLLEPDS